jgi:F0F1-type ATP synthase epsilon subunit
MAKKAAPTLNVIARAPFELYYEGPAEAVSAANKIGPFDVLPQHADFFSVLKPCTITIDKPEGDPVSFEITNGIITVRDDEVRLFCNM